MTSIAPTYPPPWTTVPRTAEETAEVFAVRAILHDAQALGQAHDVDVQGELAFVPGKSGSFAIVDVATPSAPRVVSAITTGIDNGETVLPLGDVCLLGSRHLHAIDVRDPVRPKVTAVLTDASIDSVNGMLLWDEASEYAIAASKRGHVNVFDVRDPFHPRLHMAFETRARGLIRSPHDVAILSGGRIAIVDCSRGEPRKVAFIRIADATGGEIRPAAEWQVESAMTGEEMDGANRLAVLEGAVFVACNKSDRMSVVDAHDTRAPREVANFVCADVDPCGIYLSGSVLFIAAGQTLEALDVTDPFAPRSLGWCRPTNLFEKGGANAHDLVYRDGYVYVTAQFDDSLGIVEVVSPEVRRLARPQDAA